MVVRGRLGDRRFLAFYLNQGRVDAVVGLNRGKDIRRAMALIKSRDVGDPRQFADEDIDLRSLAQTQITGDHK